MLYFSGRFHLNGTISWQASHQESEVKGLTISFTLHREINRRQALTYIRDALTAGKVYWLYPVDDAVGEWFLDAYCLIEIPELSEYLREGFDWLRGKIKINPQFEKMEIAQTTGEEKTRHSEILIRFIATEKEVADSIRFRDLPDPSNTILKFQKDYPDPSKCAFVMMKHQGTDLHTACLEVVRAVCRKHGISALRAEDKSYTDDVLLNTRAYMQGCGLGIALFERYARDEFDPAVGLAVGYMLAMGKPVCILKDIALETLPTDSLKDLYEPFDPQAPEESIAPVLEKWLEYRKSVEVLPKNWTF